MILAFTPIFLSWLWSTTEALTNSGYGQALPEHLAHGQARAERHAEVEADEVAEPAQVLERERGVEAQELPERRPRLGRERALEPDQLIHDVAGQQAHQDEDDQRGAEKHRDHERQPLHQVERHGIVNGAGSRKRRRTFSVSREMVLS
jgi:hypothetical protein